MELELETPRLRLRRMGLEDAEALHRLTGDAEVMRYVGANRPISLEETRGLIAKSITHYATYDCGCFGVVEKASARFIGYAGFTFKNSAPPELLYGFEKASWGKGLAWEAASALIERARTRYGFSRVIATVDPANTGSVRILLKLGMKHIESRLDEHGLPEDLYELSLAPPASPPCPS